MAKILHVEDAEDQRMLVGARLRKAGHNVISVATAAEAIAAVSEKGLPDVAVLDVGLPDGSGTDLLVRLREIGGVDKPAAVFLSAGVSAEEIEAAEGFGARYLTKPFIATALLMAIDRAVAEQATEADTGW